MAQYCSNCGNLITDASVFCNNCGNKLISESGKTTQPKTVEIKGDFPTPSSKIPLNLLPNENLILQSKITIIDGMAASAILSLTTKRILIHKDKVQTSNILAGGILGAISSATVKSVPEISLSDISSLSAKTIRGNKSSVEIITKDGYSHKFIFLPSSFASKDAINVRDSFVELILSAIN